jgi:curved DNA-binding protein CbpA
VTGPINLDHYEVLDVPRDADFDTIRRSYHRLARDLHPDIRPNAATAMRLVNAAWSDLNDPIRRRTYDLSLSDRPRTPTGPLYRPRARDGHEIDEDADYQYRLQRHPRSSLRTSFAGIIVIVLLLIAMITPYLGHR